MWLSCSSFFTQFFPLYDPVKFGRKADPNGDYIRKYLPVLKNYPINYIHEPWKAPEQVQKAARCIVGVDYPRPMIDHEFFAKQNQERMRQVYQTLSTYRNLKTPASTSADDNDCNQVQQQQTNSNSNSNTISNVNPSSNLSQQQKIEQQKLMPAPLHIPQQPAYNTNNVVSQSQQEQNLQQQQSLQNHQQSLSQVANSDLPQTTADDDQNLEIDALTPSINNYQPQLVSETLKHDALQKDHEYDLYHSETGFLDAAGSSNSTKK